jgi:hypothetical protein
VNEKNVTRQRFASFTSVLSATSEPMPNMEFIAEIATSSFKNYFIFIFQEK